MQVYEVPQGFGLIIPYSFYLWMSEYVQLIVARIYTVSSKIPVFSKCVMCGYTSLPQRDIFDCTISLALTQPEGVKEISLIVVAGK